MYGNNPLDSDFVYGMDQGEGIVDLYEPIDQEDSHIFD